MLGFIAGTGRERAEAKLPHLPPFLPSDVDQWIEKYCAEHPSKQLAEATMALVDELKSRH